MKRTLLLLALVSLPAAADSGQGTAEPGARVEELRLGTHWQGPELAHEDLIGKVVLVELWGS
ncbi:MAG: hypothetical protein HC813_01390 [Planctomycetes bacterium]|nr:hypothetical protein [Planctomycetota bacterium]